MSQQIPSPETSRRPEGPARLYSDHHSESMLRKVGGITGLSLEGLLNFAFGEEGTGWVYEEGRDEILIHAAGDFYALKNKTMDNPSVYYVLGRPALRSQ